MPTFKKAPKSVIDLSNTILCEFETHQPLLDAHVRVDLVMAYGETDDKGEVVTDALKHHGVKALGIARVLPLKERAKGNGDAEICLDGDWWETASEPERRALLDHELHHIAVKTNRDGVAKTDDLMRPKLGMRKHDFQFGWFNIIAQRHGESSQERQQAKQMADNVGQLYWPEMVNKIMS